MMRRGEVWLIRLDPTVGAEIRKIRPVIIVSSNEIGVLHRHGAQPRRWSGAVGKQLR